MKIHFLCLLFLWGSDIYAQSKFTISGYVEDASNGERLLGANVGDFTNQIGTSTNNFGFYSLTLKSDSVWLAASYIGYQEQVFHFLLNKDTLINIKLSPSIELQEVVVTASKSDKIEDRSQMGQIEVPIQQIKQIPALMGEVDVMRALKLLPGVSAGSEASSGIYVRGGSPDQNLILLDGVPVYNASHLFGFFSVFNSDALKDVNLYKGGFPARYGGRLSSIIDLQMKEGNSEKFSGEGSIGLIASRLTLQGPIKKGKTSYIVSGRRTYIDLLAKPLILSESGGKEDIGYYFWDLNGKINHKFSNQDRLFFSVYAGQDELYANSKGEYSDSKNNIVWGNVTSALRWNHVWNQKLFSNTTLTYSNFNLSLKAFSERNQPPGDKNTIEYRSGIEDIALKFDFDYFPSPFHSVKFGASGVFHTFKPSATQVKYETSQPIDTTFGDKFIYAGEISAYIEDDMEITKNWKANIGVHFSCFPVDGKLFPSVQPRISTRYKLGKGYSIKGSFAMMTQFIHLLTNEGIGLPTDLWVPSTKKILPEQSWIASVGAAKSIGDNYEVSVEAYYKRMDNVMSYKEGASYISSSDWQNNVSQGLGESYGLELFLQKKVGKFTGWIGYTLSWNYRQFADINQGKVYPFKYDNRHNLSLVGSYQFNEKWRLSATWVYNTGNALTLPVVSTPDGNTYSSKNAYRMPDYHRMDIGVEYMRKHTTKKGRKWSSSWMFGAYNAYSRMNPFYISSGTRSVNPPTDTLFVNTLDQVTLFPIIPYFSYNFKF